MEIIICYLYFYLCNEILVNTFGIVIISAISHKKTITIIFLDLSQFQFVIDPCTPLILDFQGIYFAAGIKNMSKKFESKKYILLFYRIQALLNVHQTNKTILSAGNSQ